MRGTSAMSMPVPTIIATTLASSQAKLLPPRLGRHARPFAIVAKLHCSHHDQGYPSYHCSGWEREMAVCKGHVGMNAAQPGADRQPHDSQQQAHRKGKQ